mmetsp:Transcript_82363/g.229234  ORF Transcript_82363/g.229234 Transcript_82363/m.229234 type:complete len:266 (-) Transcript_82363:166-963(-)
MAAEAVAAATEAPPAPPSGAAKTKNASTALAGCFTSGRASAEVLRRAGVMCWKLDQSRHAAQTRASACATSTSMWPELPAGALADSHSVREWVRPRAARCAQLEVQGGEHGLRHRLSQRGALSRPHERSVVGVQQLPAPQLRRACGDERLGLLRAPGHCHRRRDSLHHDAPLQAVLLGARWHWHQQDRLAEDVVERGRPGRLPNREQDRHRAPRCSGHRGAPRPRGAPLVRQEGLGTGRGARRQCGCIRRCDAGGGRRAGRCARC